MEATKGRVMEVRMGLKSTIGFLLICGQIACTTSRTDAIPDSLTGTFTDDYEIRYTINDSLWIQHPDSKYRILEHFPEEEVILVQNDVGNMSFPGKFTRIDYMYFEGMEPFEWGFCLTVYHAESAKEALNGSAADRSNPRTGCNGFPFSRMKVSQ